MTLTKSQTAEMETEVNLAVETHAEKITEDNFAEIFAFKTLGKDTEWTMKTCSVCRKPTLLHENPWNRTCSSPKIMQNMAAEYIEMTENCKRIKQIAKWVKPEATAEKRENDSGYDKHTIFPIWEEGMSWDEYKVEINIYKSASSKKPASKFLDMIHALKASKKINISKRLSKSLEAEMESDNIIDKAVKYIETHFGETPIERNDKAMEAMQSLRRDSDEDMSEFIQRF
jgi:hypothetical protein